MAEKKEATPEAQIVEKLTKTEKYIEENRKSLTIIVAAVVVVVGGYFAYITLILQPKEKEAFNLMYVAERYFQNDSLELALNGDGNYPGFIQIIDDYESTAAGNLAHYYTGMTFLKKGEYENAIEHLKQYDAKDQLTGPLALGGVGDAYMELGNTENALEFYKKASKEEDNNFTTPRFLMKAGLVYESTGKHKEALDNYTKISEKYRESNEAKEIEKYIARAKARI